MGGCVGVPLGNSDGEEDGTIDGMKVVGVIVGA